VQFALSGAFWGLRAVRSRDKYTAITFDSKLPQGDGGLSGMER
jgi:hypothetical protein